MQSQGARKVVQDGLTYFDDPDLRAQRACQNELNASEAVGADSKFRAAHLAWLALNRQVGTCLRAAGAANASTAPQVVFDGCVARGVDAID